MQICFPVFLPKPPPVDLADAVIAVIIVLIALLLNRELTLQEVKHDNRLVLLQFASFTLLSITLKHL